MTALLTEQNDLRQIAENLRRDCLRSTTQAGSGHPTSCMSCAEIVSTLFFRQMRFDVEHPDRANNDHFILSKGHAAPILWAVMYEAGQISEEELLSLRQTGSRFEGHPTPRVDWVDVATGSLGQGLSAGLGFAWMDRTAGRSNRTYVLLGDGEIAEGSFWEAVNLAGFWKQSNLTAIIDVNGLGQSGPTMAEKDGEAYARRLQSFGWTCVVVETGNDVDALCAAFDELALVTDSPTALIAVTAKGKGVSFLENAEGKHGKAVDELDKALAELLEREGERPFTILPPHGSSATLEKPSVGDLSTDPTELDSLGDAVSPRKGFGIALRQLGRTHANIFALDGDVRNSTYTEYFGKEFPDRLIEGYIAEQNLAGMAVALSQSGQIPVLATFGAFLSRAFDQIRMAAVSRAGVKFVGTHVGVATGKDGPSQMALEDVAMFRAVPDTLILQPADAVAAMRCLELLVATPGMGYLRLFRPNVPKIYDAETTFRLGGSNVLREAEDGPEAATIIASGHTVHAALAAAESLERDGVTCRVIDLYCLHPVDREALRRAARETGAIVVVEDHYAGGGLGDICAENIAGLPCEYRHLAIRSVPQSGTADKLADLFGIGPDQIVGAVKSTLEAREQ